MTRRFGYLAAFFAVLSLVLSAPAAASAHRKKKHPKHPPAAHQTKPHPAADETDEVEGTDRHATEPGDEGAPAHPAEPAEEHEQGQQDSSSEAAGKGSPRGRSRGSNEDSDDAAADATADTTAALGPRLPPALRGGIGFGAVYRRLTWTGARPAGLVDYAMSPGPELGGWLEVYPGAFVDRGFGANLGAILSFNRGFGISSKAASGITTSGIFEDFLLGLKMRFPLGLFVPHVSAAYAGQVFLFSPRIPEVPSVFYASVRLAAGARAQIANAIDVEVEAAYLAVVDSGKQAGYIGAPEYFPGLGAYGLEAGGSIGVRVTGVFGLRGGVDFRQYALDLSHATGMLTGDQATDRYLTIWGGVEIVLDGAGGSGSAARPRSDNKPPAPPVNPAD